MTLKTVTVRINGENNGRIKIEPITGIVGLRLSQCITLNGKRIKKRAKKGKQHQDEDSDDAKYENANEDLMEARYIEILVNNLIKGYTYDDKAEKNEAYTVRIPVNIDDDGLMEFDRGDSCWDWEAHNNNAIAIEILDIVMRTDKSPRITAYDMLLEFQMQIRE